MPSAFEIVAEPNRRRILDLLRQQDRSVGELVAELELSQPSVSKHLRVLKACELVQSRVSGQRRLYRLNPAPLMELDTWLEPYRGFWNARLDALGRHLDRMSDPSSATSAGGSARLGSDAPRRRATRKKRRG